MLGMFGMFGVTYMLNVLLFALIMTMTFAPVYTLSPIFMFSHPLIYLCFAGALMTSVFFDQLETTLLVAIVMLSNFAHMSSKYYVAGTRVDTTDKTHIVPAILLQAAAQAAQEAQEEHQHIDMIMAHASVAPLITI